MKLDVRIRKKLHEFDLKLTLSCRNSRILVMVGPSGAGKTTAIRTIAGLERPDEGVITCGDDTWSDTRKKIYVSPRKRQVGYVFQEYPLFPHLTVYGNVAFAAPDRSGIPQLLETFGISHLKDRSTSKLSGGERQRCAICQALARKPRVLMLDEPFSSLDAVTRNHLRSLLKSIRSDLAIPIIHVTHDIEEARFLADDLVPVVRGRIDYSWLDSFPCLHRFRNQKN